MHTHTFQWKPGSGWLPSLDTLPADADLVLYFGSRFILEQTGGPLDELRRHASAPIVAGCSSAGEIFGTSVFDHTLAVVCVRFESATVRAALGVVGSREESDSVGESLGRQLATPGLRHVFILSDGLLVNGTGLTAGLRATLPLDVTISGGLAGDGIQFNHTLVGLGAQIAPGQIVAIGFYGDSLRIGCGLSGGWAPFGPQRLVTKSAGNVLYTLDDQPALALYKRYLGERASGLPGSGFLFPLQLLSDRTDGTGLVRTLLGINEADQSLSFAGDIPEGLYVRLMKSTSDQLIDSSKEAGSQASDLASADPAPALALVVSCVGRRIVLGQRCDEEIELASRQLPTQTALAGFYSYGEISAAGVLQRCDLHNQTLVMTLISETT
jgi:hypothetical protein